MTNQSGEIGRRRDRERIEQILTVLRRQQWDGLVCARPMNILLVSGYWPVLGNSVAVVTADGEITLVVPEDEELPARLGWADRVLTFNSRSPAQRLASLLKPMQGGQVGYEDEAATEPVTYVGMKVRGEALQHRNLRPASAELAQLRAVLTRDDLTVLRRACGIAKEAYAGNSSFLTQGVTEAEVAAALRARIGARPPGNAFRADGFCFCMSGPNSSQAYKAYQRSTSRDLRNGEFVLVHCNSYVDGLWTDITRTYFLGQPTHEQRQMLGSVLEARDAAVRQVRPGVRASAVDHAARQVLEMRGYGKTFKHATGHGVGFAAIDHNAPPRISAISDDVLAPGMTFNVEPAIYIDGVCGIRHCDMVTVTDTGCEMLTDFHSDPEDLVLPVAVDNHPVH
jgi:Xaa-Pro dipeptidase